MSQNQTITVEQAVLRGLQRRLEVSNGQCTVTIRSIARRAAREAELFQDEHPPRWVYVLTDRLLQEKGGEFWGHGTSRTGNMLKGWRSIQSRIYKFDVDNIEELLHSNGGCMICGDSNEVKTPRETFCSTCGNGGAA